MLEGTAELALRVQDEGALVAGVDVVRLVLQDPRVDHERLAEGARVLARVLQVEPAQVERGVGVLRRPRQGLAKARLRGCVVALLGLQHSQEIANDGALGMEAQGLAELPPRPREVLGLEQALGATELLQRGRRVVPGGGDVPRSTSSRAKHQAARILAAVFAGRHGGPILGTGMSIALALLLAVAAAPAAPELPPALQAPFEEGVAALKAERLTEAEAAFGRVLAQPGGQVAFVHNNLGIVYQRRGEHAKAAEQFRAAARLDPGYVAPRILLGTSLMALGRAAEAKAPLQQAVKLAPRDPLARQQLAQAYERTDNPAGAVDQYRALRDLLPQDPEYTYRLGKAYEALSEWSLRQIRDVDKHSARLFQALGHNYRVQGKSELARERLRARDRSRPHAPRGPPRPGPDPHGGEALAGGAPGDRARAGPRAGERRRSRPPAAARRPRAEVPVKRGRFTAAFALAAASALAQAPPPSSDPPGPDPNLGGLDKGGPQGERRGQIASALAARDYDRAEALLLEAVEQEPKSPDLLRLLGGVFFVKGRHSERRRGLQEGRGPGAARRAQPLHPGHGLRGPGPPRLGAARAREAHGRRPPRNPLYAYWTARLDYDDGQYAAAIRGFEHVDRARPPLREGPRQPGPLLRGPGPHDEAIRSYEEADPAEPRAEAALALAAAQPRPAPHPPRPRRRGRGPLPRVAAVRRALPPGPLPAGGRAREEGPDRRTRSPSSKTPRASTPPTPSRSTRSRVSTGARASQEKADRALEPFQRLKKEKGQAGSGR